MKTCPFCAEEIQDAAIVCKHCGRDLPDSPKPRSAASSEPAPPTTKKGLGCIVWIAIILGVLFLLGLLGALMGPQPEQSRSSPRSPDAVTPSAPASPAVSAPRQQAWTQVVSWSGNGIKQTEMFAVASREWRVSWETSNEAFAGAGIFQIMVYDANGSLVTLAANKQGVGRDVSYVRGSPGRYYLMINSGNVDWKVTVEDQR